MQNAERVIEENQPFYLLESEKKLILYIRNLQWGSVEITVQNSEPVFAKAAYKTVRFTKTKEEHAKF